MSALVQLTLLLLNMLSRRVHGAFDQMGFAKKDFTQGDNFAELGIFGIFEFFQ